MAIVTLQQKPINRVRYSAGGGGGSTITHTGSFGTKASLAPLFYQFFDKTGFTEGALASTLGFTQGETSITLTKTDGLVSSTGCTTYTTVSGLTDGFPHLSYTPGAGQQRIFAMYQYKLVRSSGTAGTAAFQMKGPRNSTGAEYSGTPRSTISFYHLSDGSAISYTNMGLITATVNDGRDDFGGFPQGYKSLFRANDWNTVEIDTYFGTVGSSDGFIKPLYNGSIIGPFTGSGFDTDALPFRTASGDLIEYVSIFPGVDGITPNDVYVIKYCDYYVDNTPERIVLGNASTWGACTKKIPLIPTAWNGNVTATMRAFPGIAAGNTVYSYVVNAAGTVSSSQSQVAI